MQDSEGRFLWSATKSTDLFFADVIKVFSCAGDSMLSLQFLVP